MIVLFLRSSWRVSIEGIVPDIARWWRTMVVKMIKAVRHRVYLLILHVSNVKLVIKRFKPCYSRADHLVLMHDPDTLITSDEVLDKLRELVSPSHFQHDSTALHIRAMALLGRLKSLHRASNTATRLAKEKTAEARQEMDQSHLNLQNLLYEKRHLEREIEKCRQFAWVFPFVVLAE